MMHGCKHTQRKGKNDNQEKRKQSQLQRRPETSGHDSRHRLFQCEGGTHIPTEHP